MTHVKTTVSVPDDVLADIDRAAHARGESRSKYITRVLRAVVRARRDAEITRRLDELFASDEMRHAQHDDLGSLEKVGTSWTDERW